MAAQLSTILLSMATILLLSLTMMLEDISLIMAVMPSVILLLVMMKLSAILSAMKTKSDAHLSLIGRNYPLPHGDFMPPLPTSCKSQPSSQSLCPIFTVLPPEIRRLIWIQCLGGLTVLLSFSHQYPCDRLCSCGGLAIVSPLCRSLFERPARRSIERRLLPILLTCQRVCETHSNIKQVYCTISNIWLQILGSNWDPLLAQCDRASRHRGLSVLPSKDPHTITFPRHSLSEYHHATRPVVAQP